MYYCGDSCIQCLFHCPSPVLPEQEEQAECDAHYGNPLEYFEEPTGPASSGENKVHSVLTGLEENFSVKGCRQFPKMVPVTYQKLETISETLQIG